MTATLNVILDALNSEPFKMNLNSISFDLISNEQMLQILSDVILWIENSSVIDIREEGADETALRIFNSLRVLNYQPPTDIEALQEWRCGIVEGEKSTIYPILEWIFQNVNIVKERAYLAKYLTKIDVPGAFQDSEVVEFSNQVSSMMEEFKRVHWQVVEVRKDSLLMEDIRNDLKAMKAEKEQLKKRIDKLERKLGNIANIEYFLQLAEKCRLQSEQVEKIGHLQQEQLNTIIYDEQKLQRLNASLRELKKIGENIDPTDKIKALKEEIETNRYVVEEKLPKEIHAKEMIVENLKKTVEVSALNENDVAELREKIERLNEEIIELVKKRDYKDEKTDKLSIYRHQASAIQRKKAILVEKLQEARTELQNLTNDVDEKKKKLREKTGKDFVITNVQFKNYVSDLRSKTQSYKQKQVEINNLKNESAILARTIHILTIQWNEFKQKIEENGGQVIQVPDLSIEHELPISKPKTNDGNELRDMISKLNEQIDSKKMTIQKLKKLNAELKEELVTIRENFNLKQRKYEADNTNLESSFAEIQKDVQTMEEEMKMNKRNIFRAQMEVNVMKCILSKMQESTTKETQMITKVEKEIKLADEEMKRLESSREVSKLSREDASTQVAMWRSLVAIFRLKLKLLEDQNKNELQKRR